GHTDADLPAESAGRVGARRHSAAETQSDTVLKNEDPAALAAARTVATDIEVWREIQQCLDAIPSAGRRAAPCLRSWWWWSSWPTSALSPPPTSSTIATRRG